MSQDIRDSEEMDFVPRDETGIGGPPLGHEDIGDFMEIPEPLPRRMMNSIVDSISRSELGWAGFILVAPLMLCVCVVVLAVAWWIAFGPPLR